MINTFFPSMFLLLSTLIGTVNTPEKVNDNNTKLIAAVPETNTTAAKIQTIFNSLNANNNALPAFESFSKAMEGFYELKAKGVVDKDIITVIDFSMSSNTKRLWVIDLTKNEVLYNSLVAHGRNTGNEFATSFSNKAESYKSSLGFYVTGEVYNGKHGMSLKLDGLERGVNDNARNRAVVIHGADYVAESFIRNNSRLGRSLGCPALPQELTKEIIDIIKNKSCLFIYHPSHQSKLGGKMTV